ncbi:MAG: hypothetical protein IJ198_04085 [Lachnospiraceae bacterium]|nr:hypothetical protein [Lachnospiraceae bacterium]
MIRKFFGFIFRLLILALVIGIPASWMIRRSYSNPEVHYFYTKEAEGEESLRFVVISDLFGYVFEGGNGVIADRAADTSPDAILIGGNMITADAGDITPLTDLIKRLSQVAPVYYSYGEQELKYVRSHTADGQTDGLREALTEAGAVVLNEEYADVSLYGIDTRIGGMYNNAYEMTGLDHKVKRRYESTYKFLTDYQNTDRFKIMLSSRPESFVYADACDTWKVDLVVSGNSLGGLVVLPHYGGVFGGSQGYFPEYIHGMYQKGDVNLFITSGLSAPGKLFSRENPIPRFNNPPEIAVLDISGLSRSAAADTSGAAEAAQAPEGEQKQEAEPEKAAEEEPEEADAEENAKESQESNSE